MFIRSLVPRLASTLCKGTYGCPDIWELEDGDFAVIGEDITPLAGLLPPSAGCAPHERMVRLPRALLIEARSAIPSHV